MNYININTGAYPISEAQIRAENPNTSFGIPFIAPDIYKVVFPSPQPAFNPATHRLQEDAPSLTNKGHWEQEWDVVALDTAVVDANLAQIRHDKEEAIKAFRDKLKENGVKVGTKWFHSDVFSRIQWLGLMIMGANVPNMPWKTRDGSFVPLTPTLVTEVFQATGVMDANLFGIAEAKIAAMKAAIDPAAYDVNTGWPETYSP